MTLPEGTIVKPNTKTPECVRMPSKSDNSGLRSREVCAAALEGRLLGLISVLPALRSLPPHAASLRPQPSPLQLTLAPVIALRIAAVLRDNRMSS
jgi:hypothetical protein